MIGNCLIYALFMRITHGGSILRVKRPHLPSHWMWFDGKETVKDFNPTKSLPPYRLILYKGKIKTRTLRSVLEKAEKYGLKVNVRER